METSQRSPKFLNFLNRRLRPLIWKLFRIEVAGTENFQPGPCLLIANHNSGALIESHSLLFLCLSRGMTVFGLNHQALFMIPFVGKYFRMIGAVTASKAAAHQVLREGHSLLIFPGGNRQALRPFSERQQNDFPWAKGWAQIAAQAKVPVVAIKFSGTHAINPILFSSKWLARLLVLPALLKVTYFPVSLAQILSAALAFGITAASQMNPWIIGSATYLAFCFTPLIPVWPAKVKIKIYPALEPNSDFIDADSLQERMTEIMSKNDLPNGKRQKYALNGVERFMLAHESRELHYNSQFVFEFDGMPLTEKILETTEKWIELLPHSRSVVDTGFYQSQRYVYSTAWFTARDLFQFAGSMKTSIMDDFCYRSFSLSTEAPVRFLLQTDGQKSRMVFSAHHTLFDGAGHAFAFELWARIYKGQEQKPEELLPFRYRSVTKKLGWKKSLELFWENFQIRPPRNKAIVLDSFIEKADTGDRKVTSKTFHLDSSHATLKENFVPLVAQAMDQTLSAIGRGQNPMLLYAPAGLRWVMKAHSTFQNAVVSQILFLKRNMPLQDLTKKITEKMKADIIMANAKFIFGTLPVGQMVSSRKLEEQCLRFQYPEAPVSCTALVVSAVFPKSFPVPPDWTNLRIAGRGTMLRSPALGVIMTGIRGKETVTIEYIPSLINESTIDLLAKNLGLHEAAKNTNPPAFDRGISEVSVQKTPAID